MAFTVKLENCECGKKFIVPAGKLAGLGYTKCPNCRAADDATALNEAADKAEVG